MSELFPGTTADPHMQERIAEKKEAMAAIKRVLDRIKQEGREPDAWEKTCLGRALAEIISGAYPIALEDAGLAVTPPHERGAFKTDPLFQACDLVSLQRRYRAATGAPLPASAS